MLLQAYVSFVFKIETWALCATYPASPGHISFWSFVSL